MKLVVSKDSWHYHYWSFLRSLWGWGDLPDQTSLCPYCQTMIWLSVLTTICSPLIILGWTIQKLFRLVYKGMESSGLGQKIIDLMEYLFVGEYLDRAANKMESCPAFVCVVNVFAFVVFCLAIILFVSIILGGVAVLPYALYMAVTGLWMALTYVGWGVVWAFAWIGYALIVAAESVIWFFTNGPMWLAVANFVLWAVIYAGSAIALGFVFGFCFFKFAKSATGKAFWDVITYKFNGFKESRAETAERRKVEKAKKVENKIAIERGEMSPPTGYKVRRFCANYIVAPIATAAYWTGSGLATAMQSAKDFFVSTEVDVKGTASKMLSPTAIMWQFALALKHRACPLVEFVDAGAIKEKAEEAEASEKEASEAEETETPESEIEEETSEETEIPDDSETKDDEAPERDE